MFFDELLEAGDTRVGGRADANAHLLLFGHLDIDKAGDADHRRFAIAVPVKRSATVACGCTFKENILKSVQTLNFKVKLKASTIFRKTHPCKRCPWFSCSRHRRSAGYLHRSPSLPNDPQCQPPSGTSRSPRRCSGHFADRL